MNMAAVSNVNIAVRGCKDENLLQISFEAIFRKGPENAHSHFARWSHNQFYGSNSQSLQPLIYSRFHTGFLLPPHIVEGIISH